MKKLGHLKCLNLLVFTGALAGLTACAPQRARFTNAAFKSSSSSALADSKFDRKITTPEGTTVEYKAAQIESLKELVAVMDANTGIVTPGMSRVVRVRNKGGPTASHVELRKQVVRTVDATHAELDVLEEPGDKPLSTERVELENLKPLRQAVRSVSQEKFDDVIQTVLKLYAFRYGFAALPLDASYKLVIREAAYFPALSTYKLLIHLVISEKGVATVEAPPLETTEGPAPAPRPVPKGERRFVFDLRFNPHQPKPFDISYLAYGIQNASNVLLDTLSVSK